MKNFNDYAEKAIEKSQLKSHYRLAKELNISHPAMSKLRNGKCLPSSATMLKTAELAGISQEQALVDLAAWATAEDPEVNKVWKNLLKMIGCFLIVFFVSEESQAFETVNLINQECTDKSSNIYYVYYKKLKIIKKQLIRKINAFFTKKILCCA